MGITLVGLLRTGLRAEEATRGPGAFGTAEHPGLRHYVHYTAKGQLRSCPDMGSSPTGVLASGAPDGDHFDLRSALEVDGGPQVRPVRTRRRPLARTEARSSRGLGWVRRSRRRPRSWPDAHGRPAELATLPPVAPVLAPGRTAGCPSGQRERSVKPSAQPTLVRIHHPPPAARTAPDQRKR